MDENEKVDKMLTKSAMQRAKDMKERLAQKAEKADNAKKDQQSKKHISFSK